MYPHTSHKDQGGREEEGVRREGGVRRREEVTIIINSGG